MCHGANHHLLSYYESTGQTEEADKQRKANANLNKMRKSKITMKRIEQNQSHENTPILNNFFSISNPTQVVIKIVGVAIVVFAGTMIYQMQ